MIYFNNSAQNYVIPMQKGDGLLVPINRNGVRSKGREMKTMKSGKNHTSMMGKDIEIVQCPQLPPELKEAYDRNELVVFIGAGISRIAGCMGWDQLANNLVDKVFDDYAEKRLILNSRLEQKEKITIAYETAKERHLLRKYWKEFKKAINPKKANMDIYKELIKLNTF